MGEPTKRDDGTFLGEILGLAVAIELECAGVYEALAIAYQDDEELRAFWALFAEAERYHAATIRIHQSTFAKGRVESGDSFPTEAEESRAFLTQLRDWRAGIAARTPSRDEAFRIAREIENHTAELHGRTQFFRLYPEFEALFDRMVAEDTEHRGLLDDAEARFTA